MGGLVQSICRISDVSLTYGERGGLGVVKTGIVGARSYVRLEQALNSDVRGLAGAPLGSTWLLVPTNLLALHLARLAAQATGGVMGLRCMTLRDAAARLACRSLALGGMRPVPPGALELVLDRALGELPPGSHFAQLQGFAGTAGAVLVSIELLKNALWIPGALQQAAERLAETERDASRRFGELAALWKALERFGANQRFYDDEDVLLAAARPARQGDAEGKRGAPQAVLLYGFYDLTALQMELVAQVAAPAHVVRAYLLWDEEDSAPLPGFEYARPTLGFLQALLGVERVELLGDVTDETDLVRLRRGVFRAWSPGRGEKGKDRPPSVTADGSVRIVHCPGEVNEAQEVAREVLRQFRASPGPLSVGVLARTAEGLAETLSEALDGAGVRYYMSEGRPLAGAVGGRILLSLLELVESKAERADVIEFLSVARVQWPDGLHVTALDRVSRLAGIVRGWDAWPEGLIRWSQSQSRAAQGAELDSQRAELEQEAKLGRAAAQFVRDFFGQIRRLQEARTWQEMAGRLCALGEAFVPDGADGRSVVLELVQGLSRLDASGAPADVRRAAWVLGRSLRRASRHAGRFQRSGVAFSGIMTSRGPTFDVVFVPRLLEKGFPLQVRSDPVLSDRDRRLLNGLARSFGAGELPLQLGRPEEERCLFRIALGSARRAVVLSYPRIEQDTGRAFMPSRFVQQTCDALCGRIVEPEHIESGVLGGLVTRVRRGAPACRDDALDEWEFDLWVHRQAPSAGHAIRYTGALSDCFRMAVRMDMLRWSRREFGPYDGKVRDPELLARLVGEHQPQAGPVSPSRLEAYAHCPFAYFLQYVLGLEEMQKPTEEVTISSLEWGWLVHEWYKAVYAGKLTGRVLGQLSDAEIEGVVEFASAEFDRLGAAHAVARPAAWTAAKERALDELMDVLGKERAEDADAAPQRYEFAFGPQEPAGGFALSLGTGEAIQLRGRIDRVDWLDAGGIQVVDYKSGRAGTMGYKKDSFAGGRQLQLPLYLLAASSLLGRRRGRARYLFLHERRLMDEFTLEELHSRAEDLQRIVSLILAGIKSGNFFVLPQSDAAGGRYCREICHFDAVCGPARARLSAIKNHAGNTRDLKGLWELWSIE